MEGNKKIKINNGLSLYIFTINNKTTIFIFDNAKIKKLYSDYGEYYINYTINYTDDYVFISRGFPILSHIQMKVVAAYDIKKNKIIELDDELISKFSHMIFGRKSFNLGIILAFLNNLDIASIEEIDKLKKFIGDDLDVDSIRQDILKQHPQLIKYSNLNLMTIKDYRRIEECLGYELELKPAERRIEKSKKRKEKTKKHEIK